MTASSPISQLALHCLAAAFLVVRALLPAQVPDVSIERVTSQNPLAGSEVYSILQDHRGYLWVGTEKALNRYDGYNFTVFKHESENPGSIVLAKIQSLCEDKLGVLWVGTWNGLERYDRASERFSHFVPNPSASPGDWANVVYGICEDSHGNLWLGGEGVRIFERSTGKFTSMRHDSLNSGSVLAKDCDAVFEDSRGTLWIGTQAGLDRFDRSTGKFQHFWVDEGYMNGHVPNFYGKHWIQRIYEVRGGRLWLCTNGGPVAFDPTSGQFTPYSINRSAPDSDAGHSVSSMCEDDEGTLWAGAWGGGLLSYDAMADSFVNNGLFKSLAPNNSVSALYRDRSGIIWVGTTGDGLWKIVRRKKTFVSYTHDPKYPNSLSSNAVAFFFQKSQDIVTVATSLGGDDFDRRTGIFNDPDAWERPYVLTGWVRSRTGTEYTGVTFDGFNIIHQHPYRRRFLSTRDAGLGGAPCSLFEDRRGVIWMLTSDAGVCQFDPRTEKFKNLGIGGAQPFVSSQLIVEDSVDSSPDGWRLWVGSQSGLWCYDARSDAFTQFCHNPRDPASISSNSVNALFRDARGTLWVGTDQGLNRMDPAGGGFTHYTENSGLPNQLVLGILQDGVGRIWVSTRGMLSKLDPQTGKINSYSMKDLIPDIQFAPGCCLRSSQGEMFFGGQGGFVRFNPDSIADNPHFPPVILTGLRIFENYVLLDSAISEKNSVELSHSDNIFSLEFASLDFVNPEANQYAYILEGYDTSWIYIGNRQYARYVNVEPGRYTFRVRGSNSDGVWNEAGTSLAIVIKPPWWRTTWFSVLVWTAVAGSAGGGIRYIERRKLKKRIAELERERAVEQERARISRDMHDDIGSRLTEIGIITELMKRDIQVQGKALPQAQKINETVREMIAAMGEIIWATNPIHDGLDDLLAYIRHYASSYLEQASIHCHFEFPDNLPALRFEAEERRNVFLVIKEALNNVVKHSRAKEVVISTGVNERVFMILVKDDGCGFPKANDPSFGNGLRNMKKRMTDVGGTLAIDSGPGKGTMLTLTLSAKTGYSKIT